MDIAIELSNRGQDDLASRAHMLLRQLTRRKHVHRAPPTSSSVNDVIRMQVRGLVADDPDLSYAEIGRRFNINSGRVSEIIAGFRE